MIHGYIIKCHEIFTDLYKFLNESTIQNLSLALPEVEWEQAKCSVKRSNVRA